jgi:hypothetical protein
MRRLTGALLLFFAATITAAQTPAEIPTPFLKRTLTVSFGAGIPLSRQGVTSFWNMGPGGSARFMVSVSRPVSIGIGLEGALLRFNEGSFQRRFPAVEVRSRNILLTGVFLAMKTSLFPAMRFAPYVGASAGATRLSEAVYTTIIDSVRVSYYNLPAHTRLTLGVSAGADIFLSQAIAVDIEAKMNYFHHDPDLGISSYIRAGLRFTL